MDHALKLPARGPKASGRVFTDPSVRAAYEAFVDRETVSAIRMGARTFVSLLRNLPAVYPTEALDALARVQPPSGVDSDLLAKLRRDAAMPTTRDVAPRSLLPVPHPLDFEWRFTADTSRMLLDAAASSTNRNARLLLYGTPGLALEAIALPPPSRRIVFVGERNAVTRRLVELNRSTGGSISVLTTLGEQGALARGADAVLLDPPWYLDSVLRMLRAASWACAPGGMVYISLPPVGTRPGVAQDRRIIRSYAGRLGLQEVAECPLSIEYDTPFFEQNALAATGVHPPVRWRRGDLAVYRLRRRPDSPGVLPVSSGRPAWAEAAVGRMRIFAKRIGGAEHGPRGLVPLVSGDVLPTVSRRDPRRNDAVVWTSGNRIFGTDNPRLVLETIRILAGDDGPSHRRTSGGPHAVMWMVGVLRELAAIEADEEAGFADIGRSSLGQAA